MFKWPKKVNVVQFRDGKYGVRIGRFFIFKYLDLSDNNSDEEGLFIWSSTEYINKYCKASYIGRAVEVLTEYTKSNYGGKDNGVVV